MTDTCTVYVDDLLVGEAHVREATYGAFPHQPLRLENVVDFEILNIDAAADRRILFVTQRNGCVGWYSLGVHFSVRAVPEASDA